VRERRFAAGTSPLNFVVDLLRRGGYRGSGILLFRDAEDGPRVFLIRRAHEPYAGRWSFVGGAQKAGETHLDAAWRELGEETVADGISADAARALFSPHLAPPGMDASAKTSIHVPLFHLEVYGYVLRSTPPGFPRLGEEATESGWFGLRSLPDRLNPFLAGEVRALSKKLFAGS
jgi:ADP-ribose pyrophosphatase YjhB (NUDIX family)